MNPAPDLPATHLRVVRHARGDGAWNMAVDEALLASAGDEEQATLRLYGWDEPTVSLGYFQRAADRRLHPPSAGCPFVRRATGGGAIVHDAELTYSLAVPLAPAERRGAAWLYRTVHEALVAVLAQWRVEATLAAVEPEGRSRGAEPFLCFERRSAGDVLVGGHKVCGSAQRRRRDAVVQHGSILLARSPAAVHLPGLSELAGAPITADALGERLAAGVAQRLDLTPQGGDLSPDERQAARRLEREKYAAGRWSKLR